MTKKMTDLEKKRKSIEVGRFESWLTHGKGSYHFENCSWLRSLLDRLLRCTGLRARGERNALGMEVRSIVFEFDDLPAAFDGFRILHLSDLHADGMAGLAESVCAAIEELEYDLCVLTGDYRFEIYGPYHAVHHAMTRIVAAIDAPCGTLGILGNHDFAEAADMLDEMGVTMLVNSAHAVRRGDDSLWFAGVDDPHYYGCDDLPRALGGVPGDAFKILLVHSPEIYEEAERMGCRLYLCGHTHAGQICVPLIGSVMVNASCPRKYTKGVWRFNDMRGFTSAGVGNSMVPVRFFCNPEIGLIELKRST